MKKQGILFLCLGMFFSCQSDNKSVSVLQLDNSSVVVCDESKVNDKQDIPLSELVDDLQIIRLENKEEAYFKFQWMVFSDHYICVLQRDGSPVKLFDKSGKFMGDIGAVGRGPGEYSSIYDALIDEKGQSIYLASFIDKSILKYDLAGNFRAKIDFGERLNKPRLFLNPDSTLSLVHICFKDMGNKFVAANIQTSQIDSINHTYVEELATTLKDKEGKKVGFEHEIWSYRNADDFPFMLTSTDTLYHYNSMRNEVKACFTVTMDKEKKGDNFFIFNELPRHYWVSIVGDNGKSILIDKVTHDAFQAEIVNDFLGNLKIIPRFQDGYFFDTYEPTVLKEKLEEHLASGGCPEDQVDKLKEFMSTLKENDNYILFLGKLKK